MTAASSVTTAYLACPASSQHQRQLQHQTVNSLHDCAVLHQANRSRSCRKPGSTVSRKTYVNGIGPGETACHVSPLFPVVFPHHASTFTSKHMNEQYFQLGLHNAGGARHGDLVHQHGIRGTAFITSSTHGLNRNTIRSSKRRLHTVLAITADEKKEVASGSKDVAILWFKKDLRLDDHPGLAISTTYRHLLPVYIFDPYLLRGWSRDMLEALVEAVAELRVALQGMSSDLIIRLGSVKAELTSLAAEVQAEAIIAEEEIEHEWREAVLSMKDGSDSLPKVTIETWKLLLYESKGKPFPNSYKEFQKLQFSVNVPLQTPASLPELAEVLEKGSIPPASVIEDDVRDLLENNIWHKTMKDLKRDGAETLLNMKDDVLGDEMVTQTTSGVFEGLIKWREKFILANPYEALEKRKEELAFNSRKLEVQKNRGIGATSIRGTLDAYLRFLEPTRREDWRLLYEVVSEAEYKGPRGVSFRTIFGNALTLGSLSRRRIYHEAFEYEKARNGGWSSPFGFSTFTAIAAVNDVKSSEWYRLLAANSQKDCKEKGWNVRTWCWRGFHIEYVAEGHNGLPIVLVHGFGAFWEHYRDNIRELAGDRYRVWALTLLGFGRSEKPDVAYTEILWAELLRDFLVEVVGEPAILVGNSIGGYMVSMVAGLWPQLIKGLILLNAAGTILPEYLPSAYTTPKARTGITWAGSRVSLTYLRSAVSNLLKKYYSVNPSRVDKWLTGEILRASHDPGAAIVIESFYCLLNPFPLNWFLDRFKGKVFAIQGSKDPLSNAERKKQLFESHCSNVEVELVNAGHCPHDEIPDEVNTLILNWLQKSQLGQAEDDPVLEAVQSVPNIS